MYLVVQSEGGGVVERPRNNDVLQPTACPTTLEVLALLFKKLDVRLTVS